MTIDSLEKVFKQFAQTFAKTCQSNLAQAQQRMAIEYPTELVDHLKSENNSLSNELNQARLELDERANLAQNLQENLASLTVRLDESERLNSELSLERLNSELLNVNSMNMLRDQLDARETESNALRTRLAEAVAQCERLQSGSQAETERLVRDNQELSEKLTKAEFCAAELSGFNEQLREQLDQGKVELDTQISNSKQLVRQIKENEQRISELDNKLKV